ncbi:FtsK/SpoIIIE domain-containing protein [Mycobacteroides abscessus]|uniref:FtsK/SpoIIIE domain-containing protein n=1 Tax=Mycobacteroides abscessus TaxID=36809 RepID=UPI00078BDDA3|nr:FtsK/SpoIIIE domain-containing protein [Mycobacteroides abscessus]AMU64502.1 hypothetical protein A3O04_03825 [Mycobacteroides abscessus]MBE5406082.1 hypothetical protein [Mycobacteroides abscessus]MBE5429204.1 hypothetical protein [Mycobacteroides abscessus]MBE5498250.1 hypothetical protein [Mycobacteroides abscessus]MBN7424566.1 hypothetical protein [Mycobacteroides abscessus subsp. massiliense]
MSKNQSLGLGSWIAVPAVIMAFAWLFVQVKSWLLHDDSGDANYAPPQSYSAPDVSAVSSGHSFGAGWLVPVLVVAAVSAFGLFLLLARAGARIGLAPAGLTPGLAALYESVTGKRDEFDTVMISLGLFSRSADGSVVRPTVLDPVIGDHVDVVCVRPLPGTASAWIGATRTELPHLFSVPVVLDDSTPGVLGLSVEHTPRPAPTDALAAPLVVGTISAPPPATLRVGVSESGHWLDVPLANRAGVVVGGQPGSGKTGSLRSMLACWIPDQTIQLAVVDGKGSSDWQPLAPRCFAYLSTVDDLESVAGLLRSVEAERARRVAAMAKLRGSSNFWDVGPGLDLPLLVVVIDEVQTFVSRAYHPSKSARELVDEVTGLLLRLIAQGRSAGIVCILATQKPTADNLPTSLRDSAGIKLCFSVPTRAAAEAVLGDAWTASESGVSPVGAPQGIAVYTDGLGELSRIRSPFAPDSAVAEQVSRFADLVVDPRRGGHDQ